MERGLVCRFCVIDCIVLLCLFSLVAGCDAPQLEERDMLPNTNAGFCSGGPLEPFPLHFVVLTNKPRAPQSDSIHNHPLDTARKVRGQAYFHAFVEALNRRFTGADGPICGSRGCVRFSYGSHDWLSEVKEHSCAKLEAVSAPTRSEHMEGGYLKRAVNSCHNPRLRRDRAINVYIYDSCKWADGDWNCDKRTGHGAFNRQSDGVFRNYVFLDYQRVMLPGGTPDLDRVRQAAEEHEMGHAFGLVHLCSQEVNNTRSESNIMQSAACAPSGGRRNMPFGFIATKELSNPELDEDCDRKTRNGASWDQRRRILCIAEKTQQSWCTSS